MAGSVRSPDRAANASARASTRARAARLLAPALRCPPSTVFSGASMGIRFPSRSAVTAAPVGRVAVLGDGHVSEGARAQSGRALSFGDMEIDALLPGDVAERIEHVGAARPVGEKDGARGDLAQPLLQGCGFARRTAREDRRRG